MMDLELRKGEYLVKPGYARYVLWPLHSYRFKLFTQKQLTIMVGLLRLWAMAELSGHNASDSTISKGYVQSL